MNPLPPFQPNQEYSIDFFKLPPGSKILAVKQLVEWTLVESEDIAECVDHDRQRKKELNFYPIAVDKSGCSYWYFDEGIYSLFYRDKADQGRIC